jgi:peroxiredoxin
MKPFPTIAAAACTVAALTFTAFRMTGAEEPAGGEQDAAEAPAFTLPDPDGKEHSLADFRDRWVVLEWTNHGCPFVVKHYKSGNMQGLQKTYAEKDVVWLTICSSGEGKQGHMDGAAWKEKLKELGAAATHTLLDPEGRVGKLYKAKTTPHMFVIDPKGNIVYRGAIDDKAGASAEQVKDAKNYIAEVLDAVLAGKPAPVAETKPYG